MQSNELAEKDGLGRIDYHDRLQSVDHYVSDCLDDLGVVSPRESRNKPVSHDSEEVDEIDLRPRIAATVRVFQLTNGNYGTLAEYDTDRSASMMEWTHYPSIEYVRRAYALIDAGQ